MPRLLSLRAASWVLLVLALAGVLATAAGTLVEARARERFGVAVAADARLRQALLASEIARFRLLPLALADDRDVIAALRGQAGAARRLDVKLETLARRTGAAVIYVIGREGRAIAASNFRGRSFVGEDYRFRRYYRDALRRGSGEQFALGTISGRPGLYLSRASDAGGVVVVKLEFDGVERQWRAAGGITFVTDRNGIVLVASRPGWRFAATRPLPAARAAAVRADMGATLRPAPYVSRGGGRIAVGRQRGPWLLAATAPDAAGWRVALALPTRGPIDAAVRIAQGGMFLLVLALAGIGWSLRARAARRARRTAALEAAVAERTAALTREIDERAAAEAHAAELREGLRQANRLATLGQITASVAHETAQPVAAIRTYAASAGQLLDRGETGEVHANLKAIARLADRIGSVTAELRGFSRKGSGAIEPVALREVIDGARLILKERLAAVAFDAPALPPELRVIAGRVRLEQVLVILIQNAIEALDGRADARITVTLAEAGETVRLRVADNGPGVSPAIVARLFTPFATSRPTGLGLGLVIAHDIMVDLGGALRLVPDTEGACFEIELRRAA